MDVQVLDCDIEKSSPLGVLFSISLHRYIFSHSSVSSFEYRYNPSPPLKYILSSTSSSRPYLYLFPGKRERSIVTCVAVVVRQSPGIFSRLTWFGYLNSETHRYAQAYLQRGIDSQRVGTKERRCNKHISFNSAFPDHRPSKYKDTVVRQQNGIIRFNHLMYAR